MDPAEAVRVEAVAGTEDRAAAVTAVGLVAVRAAVAMAADRAVVARRCNPRTRVVVANLVLCRLALVAAMRHQIIDVIAAGVLPPAGAYVKA